MSLVLLSLIQTENPIDTRLRRLFPNLSIENQNHLVKIANIIDEKIYNPIIEAKEIEFAIINKSEEHNHYLSSALIPLLSDNENWKIAPELLYEIYDLIRRETKDYVTDELTSKILYEVFEVIEEHDQYIIDINSEELISLIESVGPKEYLHNLKIIQLIIPVILLSYKRKPTIVNKLSLIAQKYANRLEPFVANFQISLTSELTSLREKTSEEEIEKAKEL